MYCGFPGTARRVSFFATGRNTACLDAAVFWPAVVSLAPLGESAFSQREGIQRNTACLDAAVFWPLGSHCKVAASQLSLPLIRHSEREVPLEEGQAEQGGKLGGVAVVRRTVYKRQCCGRERLETQSVWGEHGKWHTAKAAADGQVTRWDPSQTTAGPPKVQRAGCSCTRRTIRRRQSP